MTIGKGCDHCIVCIDRILFFIKLRIWKMTIGKGDYR